MKIALPAGSQLYSPDFVYGVATSAFQIEGGSDNRLPSIWDTFCNETGRIRDGSDAQIACDHYTQWADDVALMAELGVDAYRFSIAWTRVIREDGSLNPAGVDFYRNLLDALVSSGIRPFATLYHWDLPQHLEDQGGWLNRDTAYRFRDYADAMSRVLGDAVHSWATLNEPFCSAVYGYQTGMHAPGKQSPVLARTAAHHLLLAHGLTMPVLQANCPQAKNGIVLNFSPCYAATNSEADQDAAGAADQFLNRWYSDPLFVGRYPELFNRLAPDQRPDIIDGDLDTIAAPLDFLGVNYYSRGVFRAAENGGFEQVEQKGQPVTQMGWEIFPRGLTDLLQRLDRDYALPPVYITENGAAFDDQLSNGECRDEYRTAYLQEHLRAVDTAQRRGVDVRGYFAWSLMDNFEWAEGYTRRFGLVHVDYETQQRTLKSSARAYRDLISVVRQKAA